jgi:hypothetical protein
VRRRIHAERDRPPRRARGGPGDRRRDKIRIPARGGAENARQSRSRGSKKRTRKRLLPRIAFEQARNIARPVHGLEFFSVEFHLRVHRGESGAGAVGNAGRFESVSTCFLTSSKTSQRGLRSLISNLTFAQCNPEVCALAEYCGPTGNRAATPIAAPAVAINPKTDANRLPPSPVRGSGYDTHANQA